MIVVAGEALIDLLEALFAGERTRDAVTLSLDLNLRPSIVGDRARERQRVERHLRLAHLVKASEEDLAWLYPDRSVDETRRAADPPTRAEVDALPGRRDVAERVPTTTGHQPGPVS